MKFKTSAKAIKDSNVVIGAGYCALQNLLTFRSPLAYTCGVYGWNSDIYEFRHDDRKFMISTGYRPFSNVRIDRFEFDKLCRKYENRATEILDQLTWYEEKEKAMGSLLADFCGDICSMLKKSEDRQK